MLVGVMKPGYKQTNMVRFRSWSFREYKVPLQVYSDQKWYYLPTPPLGQDMTQGQFLSGV